ncbi:MAG TPA: M48 family metallopeptidase [Actinomycetota bacterium]|nr:M48 family metallopeptidase [Actinomycetota bacterium]
MRVEVVRSPRRRKTITAERRGSKVVVLLPAGMTRAEERTWVDRMVTRLTERERLERLNAGRDLERRAEALNERFFEGRLWWRDIRYVPNPRSRFGSCTPEDRTIRISDRVAEMPGWVRDYVVIHELAHLRVPSHSDRFWRLVHRYPLTERARGYLLAKGLEE